VRRSLASGLARSIAMRLSLSAKRNTHSAVNLLSRISFYH
jgi:hypothetical protein